jgi:hypothetical protein
MPFKAIPSGPFAGVVSDVDTSRCGVCRGYQGVHVHPLLPEDSSAATTAAPPATTPPANPAASS